MGTTNQIFAAIMWKNLIVRKRHYLFTLIEIVAPCIIFGFISYLHISISSRSGRMTEDEVIPHEFGSDRCFNHITTGGLEVGFSPNNEFTSEIMKKTEDKIWKKDNFKDHPYSQRYNVTAMPFDSAADIENYYVKTKKNYGRYFTFIAVIFDNSPSKFKYTIRYGSIIDFNVDKTFPRFISSPLKDFENVYLSNTCFATLQKTLDEVYIEHVTNKDLTYKINLWNFPYPARSFSLGQIVMETCLPYIVVFCFSIIMINIIRRVVEEKESGVKELMKMMGLKRWMVWVGWLVYANMVNIFITIIITVLLTSTFGTGVTPIIAYTNPLILWFLLFLFMNAATVFLFIICAFFHKPLIAISVGLILHVTLFILLNVYSTSLLPLWLKLMACLIPTNNVKEGLNIIFAFDSRAVGVQLSNLFETTTSKASDLSMGLIFVMFILEILLFGVTTWYIDNVRPGPYGRAKPWYFIFNVFAHKRDEFVVTDDEHDVRFFEAAPSQVSVGLSIRNLTKFFPPNVPAVNGVSIDIYKGQITALLGHNGAGKTTTMSILTGLYSPTSGTVHYHDSDTQSYNVFENMTRFRQDLGLCPQHNMLFTYFTVIEHLLFFGILKGLSLSTARKNGRRLLQMLNILDKANLTVNKLSGGMKRKLSLAVSVIAEPKILVLDEPTSGMDPESRREMWDVLLNLREGRTIIITTHFMEEADVLGDRIAIMDHGKVRCYGTSIFLKKVYGAGYNLTLLTKPAANRNTITNYITSQVPESKLRTFHPGQLVYNLPTENSSKFAELFSGLESKKSELNITSIGVSCTTMEDVFLKVGGLSDLPTETDKTSKTPSSSQRNSNTEHLSLKKISGIALIMQQFCVLFRMKIKYTYRKFWSYVFFLVISIIMLGLALYSNTSPKTLPLLINLHLFPDSQVISTFTSQPESTKMAEVYDKIVLKGFDVKLIQDGDLIAELLSVAKDNLVKYNMKYVVSADWGQHEVNAFYSDVPFHAVPITLNLVTNTILKVLLNDESQSIEISNYPFTESTYDECNIMMIFFYRLIVQITWAIVVPIGMLFMVANFIAFPLLERVSCSKHLQLITGLSPITYWLAGYLWDMLLFMTMTFLCLIPILLFDSRNMFSSPREIGVFLLLVNCYGISGIMFAYFFSFLRNSSAGATSTLIFCNILLGVPAVVIMFVLNALNILTDAWYSRVNGILLLNPFYCVLIALVNFSGMAYDNAVCKKCSGEESFVLGYKCDEKKVLPYLAFHRNGKEGKEEMEEMERIVRLVLELIKSKAIGWYVLYLSLIWILYFFLILLIEYGIIGTSLYCVKKLYQEKNRQDELDNDVAQERNRVDAARTMRPDDSSVAPVLLVDGLTKKYGLTFTAVNNISFSVSSGECFGLLGVNGAGKTTTFKMITGEEIPSAGNVKINKYSLIKNRSKYLKQIGYCPQFDAINEVFTGEEILTLYGLLRGLTKKETKYQTDYWVQLLGLEEYSKRKCGTYSGGNKRKLSAAISLIGYPLLVFLDEPTSGIDPVARRKLWSVLTNYQKAGKSVVLTSHSMDECEALCNRLTIMVNGQMVCIGNIQYLKQKFGKGYTVMVKLRSQDRENTDVSQLKTNIETVFAPHCYLKDEHIGLLHYHINDTSKTWSVLFQTMANIKRKHPIVEDYIISETTLEQVFISFAKEQKKK